MNDWLERNRGVVLTTLAAILVVGVVMFLLEQRGGPKPLEIRFDDAALNGTAIEVYVTGAVQQPGVYTLHDGDRIEEALAAAGGATADADTESINLAERVVDEEKLEIRVRGETGPQLDINSASVEQLNALPGIGDVYAQKIVESRQGAGPFRRTEELVERKVISATTYDKIKDLITAGP